MKSAAVVLFSGGQDSATCLAWALSRHEHVETLGFDYGQRHIVELELRPALLQSMRAQNAQWASRLGEDHRIDLSLLGSLVRLMGWTFTTTMWRDKNPVTGQARITGTPERPGISASFNDRDGKPLVFQLVWPDNWKDARPIEPPSTSCVSTSSPSPPEPGSTLPTSTPKSAPPPAMPI